MQVSIIIPAHNEAERIGRTLRTYNQFFSHIEQQVEFVVVLNGCTDNTLGVVQELQDTIDAITVIDLSQAGKGLAIKAGFADALTRSNDCIGFVDADMATTPEQFYELVANMETYDGIIASRYMPESQLFPPRPWVKRWGSKLFYESLIWALFGMNYYDYQCGAKLFKRSVIEKVVDHLQVTQWAFDVELLYLCKKFGFTIKEIPTVWRDQADSKLKIHSGFAMLGSLFKVRWRHRGKV